MVGVVCLPGLTTQMKRYLVLWLSMQRKKGCVVEPAPAQQETLPQAARLARGRGLQKPAMIFPGALQSAAG